MWKLNKTRTVTSNFVSVFIGEVLCTGISLLTALVLANGLGAVLFGLVSIATSLTEVFFSISDMGMQSWSIREMSRSPDSIKGTVRSLTRAKLIVALAIFISFTSVSFLVYGFSIFIELFVFFAFSLVADTFTLVLYSVFQAVERMYLYSASRVLATSVFFIGSYITVEIGAGITLVGMSYMLSRYSVLGFSLLLGFGLRLFKGSDTEIPITSVFKASAPFAILVVLTSVIPRSDIIMLSFLFIAEPQLAGIYAAALKIFLITTMIATALLIGLYPLLSSSFVSDTSMFKYTARKTLKYLLIGGTLLSLLFLSLSIPLVAFLYTAEYVEAGLLLQILGFSSFLTFSRMGFEWIFNAADMQNKVVKCSGARFVTNILLNFSVFYIGLVGIAIASVVAEIIALVGFMLYVRKSSVISLGGLSMDTIKILIAAGLTLIIFNISIGFIPIVAGFFGLVFQSGIILGVFGIIIMVLVIDKDDIRLLKQALRTES